MSIDPNSKTSEILSRLKKLQKSLLPPEQHHSGRKAPFKTKNVGNGVYILDANQEATAYYQMAQSLPPAVDTIAEFLNLLGPTIQEIEELQEIRAHEFLREWEDEDHSNNRLVAPLEQDSEFWVAKWVVFDPTTVSFQPRQCTAKGQVALAEMLKSEFIRGQI